jgi:hypothetical protein
MLYEILQYHRIDRYGREDFPENLSAQERKHDNGYKGLKSQS